MLNGRFKVIETTPGIVHFSLSRTPLLQVINSIKGKSNSQRKLRLRDAYKHTTDNNAAAGNRWQVHNLSTELDMNR